MSDARLRELEQRWFRTGAVADEAAYLAERVRVGELSWARVELATACGHVGAGHCLGRTPGPHAADLFELVSRLQPWGVTTVVRAVHAAVEIVARPQIAELAFLQPVMLAVEGWMNDPTPESLDVVREASDTAFFAAFQLWRAARGVSPPPPGRPGATEYTAYDIEVLALPDEVMWVIRLSRVIDIAARQGAMLDPELVEPRLAERVTREGAVGAIERTIACWSLYEASREA